MSENAVPAAVTSPRERIERRQSHKFTERRAELSAATLQTLGELGYARTSLREIAQNSPYSHGVLHYYFADKIDLITESVRHYKAECITRYDSIVTGSRTAAQLRLGFGRGLAATMVDDAAMHRLWYDLRSQSMFEDALRDDVEAIDAGLEAMIWRVVTRYAELTRAEPTVTADYAYATFDGLFQHALITHTRGDATAAKRLRAQVGPALDRLF